MKHTSVRSNAQQRAATRSQHRPVTGSMGMSIAPPVYGIDFVDRQPSTAREMTVQRYGGETSLPPVKQQENRTGLPDHLKAGIETLSGFDLSDVNVHFNSAKPAALQALAYTQGTDIHLAPGQERHLSHEAWHVVQQKQGRVQPRFQLKGEQINDDQGLEREADRIGTQANTISAESCTPGLCTDSTPSVYAEPIQMVEEDTFKKDPEAFLKNNILTLDFQRGLEARAPKWRKENQEFLGKLHSFSQHWFQLAKDEGRSTDTKPAYLLTPAIEKYLEAYQKENEWLAALGTKEGLPSIVEEAQYIQAAYVQYVAKKVTTLDADIGHTSITKSASTKGFNPDLVFTDAMTGCAFTVTKGDDEHFTAWHFQSPGSNKEKASEFRRDRTPLDWFGEEEYDTNEHKGLYETTNILWRSDDTWRVLSQVNETYPNDRDKVDRSTFKSRNLNLDPDKIDKLAMLKRIYRRSGENQRNEASRASINALQPKLAVEIEQKIHKICQEAIAHIEADIEAIGNAVDVNNLNSVAKARQRLREGRKTALNVKIDAASQSLTELYNAETKKYWFRKDKDQLGRLDRAINSLRSTTGIKGIFSKTAWLEDLQAETRRKRARL